MPCRGFANKNLSPDDDISYIHEFEYLTLVRVLVAPYKTDRVDALDLAAALGLLARLLQAAEEGGRNGSVIEILVSVRARWSSARRPCERWRVVGARPALVGWRPMSVSLPMKANRREGLIEGPIAQSRPPAEHLYGKTPGRLYAAGGCARASDNPRKADLIEPLSEREMEVLSLLRSELSGPEIAAQLIVSLNTLRSHTKSIFHKLGVNNRRAVVRRAEELDCSTDPKVLNSNAR